MVFEKLELLLSVFRRGRKGEIGMMEIIFVIATIIAVAITLYIVMSFAREGLVISYD